MSKLKFSKQTLSYILDIQDTYDDNDTTNTNTALANNTSDSQSGHSLGVNSLQYSFKYDTLYSGGRDGEIISWQGYDTNNYKNDKNLQNEIISELDLDYYDLNFNSSKLIKDYIAKNIENESEILKLESAVRNGLNFNNSNSNLNYKINKKFNLHLDWINDLKLLNDENFIASCSSDNSVRLLNSSKNELNTIGNHLDYAKCLSTFKNENSHLLSAGLDKKLNLWDLNNFKKISSFEFDKSDDRNSIYSLDSFDNLILSSGPSNTVYLIDKRLMGKSNKPIKKFYGHTDNVRCLSLKKNYFLSGSSDSTIKLWDLRTNRILRNFDMHNNQIWSMYIDKNSDDDNDDFFQTFYSADRSGLLLKTDLRSCNYTTLKSTTSSTYSTKEDSDNTTNNKNSKYKNDIKSNRKDINDNSIYLNNKLNENLGVCTVIADFNSSLGYENPILSIVKGKDSIWTATAGELRARNNLNADTDAFVNDLSNSYIQSWSDPITNKIVIYQNIKSRKNLSMVYKNLKSNTGNNNNNNNNVDSIEIMRNDDSNLTINDNQSQSFSNSSQLQLNDEPENDDLFDIVSNLSNDTANYDINQIDEALSMKMSLNDTVNSKNMSHQIDGQMFDLNSENNVSINADYNQEVDYDGDEDPIYTYFVNFNGSPNSEFVINDLDYSDDEDYANDDDDLGGANVRRTQLNGSKSDKIEILFESIPENLVKLIPINEKPIRTIRGSNGLINSRFLNNRRNVASMDQNGNIFIIDILTCSVINKINMDQEYIKNHEINKIEIGEQDQENKLNYFELLDYRFNEIINKYQTEETLPMWCKISTKAGKLFVSINESIFLNTEIYNDDFFNAYPDSKRPSISNLTNSQSGIVFSQNPFQKRTSSATDEYTLGSSPSTKVTTNSDSTHHNSTSSASSGPLANNMNNNNANNGESHHINNNNNKTFGNSEISVNSNGSAEEPLRFNLGKIVLKSLLYNFIKYESNNLNNNSKSRRNTVNSKRLSSFGFWNNNNNNNINNNININNDPDLSRSSSNVVVGPETTVNNTNNNTNNTNNASNSNTQNSNSNDDQTDKPKRSFFGRKLSVSGKNSGNNSSNSNGNSSNSGSNNLNGGNNNNTIEENKVVEPVDPLDLVKDTETLIQLISEDKYKLQIPSDIEVPRVKISNPINIDIVIQNEIRNNDKDENFIFYHFKLNELLNDIGNLEKNIPVWTSKFLLLNRFNPHPITKVGFIVKPDTNQTGTSVVSSGGHEHPHANGAAKKHHGVKPLPNLSNPGTRLNAHSMLRVSKVLEFTAERFTDPTIEMLNHVPVEEWLEVTCRDKILPLHMTLATVKARIWKSNSDVELCYRRKTK